LKIIFICKRYYTGKDVIRHRFGRLYEIPTQLARLGHQVTVLCLDYCNDDPHESFTKICGTGSTRWLVAPFRSFFKLKSIETLKNIKTLKSDLVIGSYDIPYLWLARKVARRMKVPYASDIYDNYEIFGQARTPGFRQILRFCIKNASIIITVNAVLKYKVLSDYTPQGLIVVMNNGVLRSSFFVGDKVAAKMELGLLTSMKLIGTAGHLSRMKGLNTVYKAWDQIEKMDDVCLVLAVVLIVAFLFPKVFVLYILVNYWKNRLDNCSNRLMLGSLRHTTQSLADTAFRKNYMKW